MSSASSKQQIIQKVKDVTNILVTVSNGPSVDELSAALGLTMFLNALGKHTAAVFSGKVPPVMTFLEPNKTFEETADSLRDFIIALNKDKADHLRYKVVDDAVKIFITPYRTTISEADLEFSQGDYNVELVLALNVENSDNLDSALAAHGKILHDAEVATITSGEVHSQLGTVDWHNDDASGVSEMTVELIDGLKTPKVTLNEQVATALLTGIVSTTDRFSNDLTSSRVMTAAAELLAAGADQQLVAEKLESVTEEDHTVSHRQLGELREGTPTKIDKTPVSEKPAEKPEDATDEDGVMRISHIHKGDLDEVARQVMEESQEDAAKVAQARLDRRAIRPVEEAPAEQPAPVVVDEPEPVVDDGPISDINAVAPISDTTQPSIGGTLNATADQAAEDKRREIQRDQNKTILEHGKPIGDQRPEFADSPLNATMAPSDEPANIDPFATLPPVPTAQAPDQTDLLVQALSNAAPAADTAQPSPAPEPPTVADDTQQVPPIPAGLPAAPVNQTLADLEADINASKVAMPPMPDFTNLPPLPPVPTGVNPDSVFPEPPTGANQPADFNPAQFRIPGQN